MSGETPFKPFTPAPLSRDLALVEWMRATLKRHAGPFYRIRFESQGGAPAQRNIAAVDPTAYRVRLFTDDGKGKQNGVSFTASTVFGLSEAVNLEAPRFQKRAVR